MITELHRWEVWYVDFPYEENDGRTSVRPVIILNTKEALVLSVKVTSHAKREYDDFDVTLKYWEEAGLEKPSVARVSKLMKLSKRSFLSKIGVLHPQDAMTVQTTYQKYVQMLNKVSEQLANDTEDSKEAISTMSAQPTSVFSE